MPWVVGVSRNSHSTHHMSIHSPNAVGGLPAVGRNQVAPRVKELYLVLRGGGMGGRGLEQGPAKAVNSNTCHPVETQGKEPGSPRPDAHATTMPTALFDTP